MWLAIFIITLTGIIFNRPLGELIDGQEELEDSEGDFKKKVFLVLCAVMVISFCMLII